MSERRVILELSHARMIGALVRAGVPAGSIFLGDEFFAAATPQWIMEDFAREWANITRQLGFKYDPERRDCEDFAAAASYWAKEFHARTSNAPEAGLAFGEAWCRTKGHAFNLGIHSRGEGNVLYVTAYEPQPVASGIAMSVIQLEPEDWASIHLAKF